MTTELIPAGKEREVRVGDKILVVAQHHPVTGTVIYLSAKYIWLEYIWPTTGYPHTIKRHRDILLMGTRYY